MGLGLWSFICLDCGFESRRLHDFLSLVGVVGCQVQLSASGLSLAQRSPTECGVSECDGEASVIKWPWPTGGYCTVKICIFVLSKGD
jgi:hypothetical protein